jgi:hypothetical protein
LPRFGCPDALVFGRALARRCVAAPKRGHVLWTLADDPAGPPSVCSRDPDDGYLLALAISRRAYLVTGDQDLLVLSHDLPILTPVQFATKVRKSR